MKAEDKKSLNRLLNSYGEFEIVKAIVDHTEHEIATHYNDNPDAVIHRDLPILRKAESEMREQHVLRMLAR